MQNLYYHCSIGNENKTFIHVALGAQVDRITCDHRIQLIMRCNVVSKHFGTTRSAGKNNLTLCVFAYTKECMPALKAL